LKCAQQILPGFLFGCPTIFQPRVRLDIEGVSECIIVKDYLDIEKISNKVVEKTT